MLAQQVMSEVRSFYKDAVFTTVIPRNIRLSEAPSHGKPVMLYDSRSKGSDAYVDLANEIIAKNERFCPDQPAADDTEIMAPTGAPSDADHDTEDEETPATS